MNLSRLKFYVDKSGYTIRTFCKEVGIKTPTYYKALKDNDIRSSVLEKMCILLAINPVEFFDKSKYDLKAEVEIASESKVLFFTKKTEIHMGKMIESRLDEVGMSVAEFGRRIGTTRQNAQNMLKRKHITWENALEYNEVLNPPGSVPWDIFEFFLRKKPDTIQEKYTRLLEEHHALLRKGLNKNRRKM